MQKLQINVSLFNLMFPESARREMEQRLVAALAESGPEQFNEEYFAHLGTYAGRAKDLPEGIAALDDLFPPNIAVLDYAARFMVPYRERILDFACGPGGLIVCLKRYKYHAWGFDRWQQVARTAAECFLNSYDPLSGRRSILDVIDIRPTTLVFVGGHWHWVTLDDAKAIFTPALRRVLVDANYSPKTIDGFELTAYYTGLLHVFERTE